MSVQHAEVSARTPIRDRKMRPCKWCFDGDPDTVYEGFTDGSHWNGCLNVWVRPETRDAIAEEIELHSSFPEELSWAAELRTLSTDEETGLVSFAYGYTTIEADWFDAE